MAERLRRVRFTRLHAAQPAAAPADLAHLRQPGGDQGARHAEVAEHPVPVRHDPPARPPRAVVAASTGRSSRPSQRTTPMPAMRRWRSTSATFSRPCSGRSTRRIASAPGRRGRSQGSTPRRRRISGRQASGFHKLRHVLEGNRQAVPGTVPLWLFVIRRGVVSGLVIAGVVGLVIALAGGSV